MSAVWRLLIDESPVDGAWNMALDRALQLEHQAGESPPTLRLYRWLRPTVTLGRFQKVADVDTTYCDEHDIDVVRRFTGGRGVLHDDEVTYSVVAGIDDGIPRGVAASYRMLCGALAGAYRLLGVSAALTLGSQGDRTSAACYLHATAADLSLGARKLSGSAQVWSGSTVLQHGSFTLSRDVLREARVFRLSETSAEALESRTATIGGTLDVSPSYDRVIACIVEGIRAELGIRLDPGKTTERETALASELLPQVARAYVPDRSHGAP